MRRLFILGTIFIVISSIVTLAMIMFLAYLIISVEF